MPELPEVEVVRRGVARWVVGRTVEDVEVVDPRSLRRHTDGPEDFRRELTGLTVVDACRRGKFLWLPVRAADGSEPSRALLVHLGMSGQLLVSSPEHPRPRHERIRLELSPALDDSGQPLPEQLRFVDQRIFGGMLLDRLVPASDGHGTVPEHAVHIARDPLDPLFDVAAFHAAADSLHLYPGTDHAALRGAIGAVHGLDPERIICGVGSDEILIFLFQAYAVHVVVDGLLQARAQRVVVHARGVDFPPPKDGCGGSRPVNTRAPPRSVAP